MTNYYNSIYLEHRKKNSNKVPAPKNFWPYSYQFYLCQPIKIFECQVRNTSSGPDIQVLKYIEPSCDRESIESERLPSELLEDSEIDIVINAIY